MNVKKVAPLTDNVNSWRVGFASPIICTAGTVSRTIFDAKGSNGSYYSFCEDMQAGVRADGTKWGNILALSDANLWTQAGGLNAHYGTSDMVTFAGNILGDSRSNRVYAALGYNPNDLKIDKQASTTTTTNYETVSKALGKVRNDEYTTLLRDHDLTPVSNELLFEESTLKYKEGTKYAGTEVFAKSAGVYIDITNDGSLNLHSGTVTVTPKDKNYVLTMNGTMDDAGTQITGGYKITATGAYTLDADDEKTPILAENGGGAKLTIPKAGTTVTVAYSGGADGKLNGKTVTYTAKNDGDSFYLGCYTVTYNVDGTVTWTADDLAWDGHNFVTKMTPAEGYEAKGEKLAVVDQTSHDLGNYQMENGTKENDPDPGKTDTWGVFNSVKKLADGVTPKITIRQQYLHNNNVDRNGYSTVTVRDVRANIIIKTTGDAVQSARPNIYVVGVGKRAGYEDEQLWAYTTQRTTDDQNLTKDVEGWPWANWKAVSAKTAQGTQAKYEDKNNPIVNWTTQQIKDSSTAGGKLCPVELTKGDMVVVFEYEWDMVDVKINAKLGSSADPDSAVDFPGYIPQYATLQRDVKGTIYAPNLSGYQPDQTSQEFTPTQTNGQYGPYEVTFYYTMAMGQVVYRAVDEADHELATWDGPRVMQGDAVSTDWKLAPDLAGYQVKQTNGTALDVDGQPATKYDGKQITVTWVYESKTRDVEIKMVEYTADGDHRGAELRTDTTSYARSPVGFTLNLTAPAIPGYTVKGIENDQEVCASKSVFVDDTATGKITVYFYYEVNTQDDAKITVQMWDKVNNEEIWSYTVPGQNGEKQLVRVPTVKGYVSDPNNKNTSIAPDDTLNADWGKGTVRFLYSPNTVKVTVKLVDSTKTAGDQGYELNSKLTNYKGSYTVVKGESIDIVAPDVYGYTLKDTTKSVYTVKVNKDETRTEIEEIIEYVPISNQMVNIKVTGTVDGGNALYTYTVQAAAGSKEYTIDAKQNIPGYKLSGATVGNNNVFDQVKNDQLTVTVPDNAKGGTVAVTLTYKSTKTTVTVKTSCDGTDLSTTYPVEKEIGQETSVVAPSIPGYTATEQTKTLIPQGNDVVTFEYTKNTGNVVLIAKAGNTELFRKDGGTKANGDTVNVSAFKAPDVTYYQRTAADPTITVNGQPFTTGSKYNGIGQIEITYQYERKTASITIVKMDADTRKEINHEQVFNGLSVGENHVFTNKLTVTSPIGYTPESGNPTSAFLADSNGAKVVFWYRQNQDSRYVNITVNLTCKDEVFETYTVRAIKGQETTVGRPSWTGYTPVQNEQGYQIVTPQDNTTVVAFNYTQDDPKTITIKLHNNTDTVDMTAPIGYRISYTLKNGDKITIQAPIMSGFTLNGYTISGGSNGTSQFVEVSHAAIKNGDTITFNYESVVNSSFVKHNVRFVDHQNHELYSYDKMVPKGTGAGTKIEYKESDVKYLIPGYTLANISYKVAGNDATDAQVTNMVDAEITYHFAEATAKIVVEQYNGGTKLSGDVELTGYRIGQENIVVTAPARTDVALKDTLTKTVTGPLAATQTVKFQYEALGNIQFWLYDAETGKLITVLNGEGGKTYTAGQDILNLSGDHYTYKADDRASDDFRTTGNGSVTTQVSGNTVKYSVYFQKATRQVTYIAMDSTKLSQNDFDAATTQQKEAAKITGIQAAAMPAARVGETYMATAQTFDGWTLDDDLTKPYTVAYDQGNLEVYFWYKAKATGTVTVNYVCGTEGGGASNFTLASYTTKAAGGEKLTVTPPQNLGDGRYTLNAGQKEQVIDVTRDGQHEVSFYYTKNFVTVNTKIVLGTAQPSEITSQDVLKTGTADFYPPYRPGYKLVGVTGVDGGTAAKLPDGFNDKVTISNPQNDVELVWYYEQTDATEYQSAITVNYLYRGAALSKENVVKAFIGVDNTIEIPTFDGYTAKSYTFNNGVSTDITDASKGITVKPTEKTATLTITYERTDGSIVLPGKDTEMAPPKDKDNVTVTPDDVDKPLIDNGDQGVKVPDNGTATVTRPTNPDKPDKGKEDITVPGGSVVKPDGTIVLPNPDGGEIGPDKNIPADLPKGFVAITYDSNNASKEVKKEIGKKGVLEVKGSLFTDPSGANFVEWNDSGLGSGKTYAPGTAVDASITLYAKWDAKYTYSATITYKPNGAQGQDVSYIVGHNTDKNLKTTLPSNLYQVPGWTFGGWNEQANGSGTLYQGDTNLNLASGDTKELFAQWYKVNADGSITVPGSDGNPNNPDTNATGNGNGNEKPSRNDKGEIEIPKGGSVTLPDGSVIGMPDGGKLLPNGTVIINRPDKDGNGKTDDGTITIPGKTDPSKPDVTDKDGQTDSNAKVITLVYKNNNQNNEADVEVKVVKGDTVKIIENPFVWTGYTFTGWVSTDKKPYTPGTSYDTTNATDDVWMFAHWVKKNLDGSVELPGKDNNLDGPGNEKDDNVIVSPDNGGTIAPQPDGSVKVENNGGTVNRPKDPDHPNDGREDIKVPEGTIVEPDGTIKLPQKPDGSDGGEIKPGTNLPDATPEGYISVVYKANGGTGDDVIVLVKRGEPIEAIANPFTNGSQSFTGWNTADNGSGGISYNESDKITLAADAKGTTLFAQWGKAAFNHTAKIIYLPNDGSANKDEEVCMNNKVLFLYPLEMELIEKSCPRARLLKQVKRPQSLHRIIHRTMQISCKHKASTARMIYPFSSKCGTIFVPSFSERPSISEGRSEKDRFTLMEIRFGKERFTGNRSRMTSRLLLFTSSR